MTPRLADTPVLETERLVLRAPELRDFDAYAAFLGSDRAGFVGGPIQRPMAWRFFGHHVGHWALRGYGTFFIERKASAGAVGMVMAWQPEGYPEKEIGWSIFGAEHTRRGYILEAARTVLRHVYGVLGWTTCVSYIHPDNSASAAVAQRLGARLDPAAIVDPDDPSDVWRHPRLGEAT